MLCEYELSATTLQVTYFQQVKQCKQRAGKILHVQAEDPSTSGTDQSMHSSVQENGSLSTTIK